MKTQTSRQFLARLAARRFARAAASGLGVITVFALYGPQVASATTFIKANNTTALNTNGSYTTAGVPGSGDTIQFDSTFTGTTFPALGGDLSVLGLMFSNPANAFTINSTLGATLTLGSSGIDMSAATVNFTLANATALGASQTWNVASGRTLTQSASLNLGTGNTLTVAGAGAATISSLVVGAGGIAQTGTGILTLSLGGNSNTANTFSGGITVASGGTVTISGTNAAGAGAISSSGTLNISAAQLLWGGGLTINGGTTNLSQTNAGGTGGIALNGGTLALTNATAAQFNTINLAGGTFTPGNGASIGALAGSASFVLGTGTYTLGFNGATATYAGNLTGATAANLSKVGTGTQTLNGTSNFTGTITVNGAGGVLEFGGQSSGNGAVAVQSGTLRLNFDTGPTTTDLVKSAALTLSGGTVAVVGKNSATNSIQNFTGTTLSTGTASTVSVTNGNNTGTAALNLGNITRGAGSTLNFVQPTGTQSATNGILVGTGTGTASSLLVDGSNRAYATVGGTDFAAKDATNTLIVGASSLAGFYTSATAGSLGATGANSDINATSGNPTINTSTVNTLRFSDSAAHTLTINSGQTLTATTGGLLVSNAVTSAGSRITGGSITSSTGAAELVVNQFSSQPFTIDSAIVNNGSTAVGLTKAGPGTLILTGANTNSGPTYIAGGTLQIAGLGSLANSNVTLAGSDNAAVFDVNNQTTTIGTLSGGGGNALVGGIASGGIVNLGATGQLSINGTATGTYSGALVGGAGSSITKAAGAGFAQSFSTSSQLAFNGTFNVNAGSFGINNASVNFQNTSFVIGPSGTFSPSTNSGSFGNFAGSGAISTTNTGAATVYSFGYVGGTTTFSGIVGNGSGTGLGISKFGSGTAIFSGANTYTGGTTVNSGNLIFDYSGGKDATGTAPGLLTLNGGTVTFRSATGGTTDTAGGTFGLGSTGTFNRLVLDNNTGTGISQTLKTTVVNSTAGFTTATAANSLLFDTSSTSGNHLYADATISAADGTNTSVIRLSNGILQSGVGTASVNNFRASVLIRDNTGYGYATQNAASNEIVKYTGATTLTTVTGSTNTTNYKLSSSLTLGSAQFLYNTLQLDSGTSAVTLTIASGQRFGDSGGAVQTGRSVLATGTNGATLTGGSGTNQALYVYNYQNGGTTAGQTFNLDIDTAGTLYSNGTGLTIDSKTVSGGLFVQSGVFRMTLPQGTGDALTSNAASTFNLNGGVLEIGADLTSGTSVTSTVDFSRSVGGGSGQVSLIGDSGFSAYGGTRTVNLGGSGAALNWGQDNFLTVGGTNNDGNATFRLSSTYSDSTLVFQNGINLNSSNRTIEVANGTAAVDARITGIIANTNVTSSTYFVANTQGSLTKTGTGTLELTANNTYNGTTSINAGTLLVNNTPVTGVGSGTGSGTVTVNNGGTLGGTGAIAGATTVGAGAQITGANLSSIGALTLLNTVTFNGASGSLATYVVDIGSGTNNSDRLSIGGVLNLSGAFDQITFMGTPDGMSSYVLATYSSISGAFDFGAAPTGYSFQYNSTELDLVPIAVPEPATWFGGGLMLGFAAWSKRKRFASLLSA